MSVDQYPTWRFPCVATLSQLWIAGETVSAYVLIDAMADDRHMRLVSIVGVVASDILPWSQGRSLNQQILDGRCSEAKLLSWTVPTEYHRCGELQGCGATRGHGRTGWRLRPIGSGSDQSSLGGAINGTVLTYAVRRGLGSIAVG